MVLSCLSVAEMVSINLFQKQLGKLVEDSVTPGQDFSETDYWKRRGSATGLNGSAGPKKAHPVLQSIAHNAAKRIQQRNMYKEFFHVTACSCYFYGH